MPLIRCGDCHAAVSTNSDACPRCGYVRRRRGRLGTWLSVGAAFLSLAAVLVAIQARDIQKDSLELLGPASEGDASTGDSLIPYEPIALVECRYLQVFVNVRNTGDRGISLTHVSAEATQMVLGSEPVPLDRLEVVGSKQQEYPKLAALQLPHYIRAGEVLNMKVDVELPGTFRNYGGCDHTRAYTTRCPNEREDGLLLTIHHTFGHQQVTWNCDDDLGAILV